MYGMGATSSRLEHFGQILLQSDLVALYMFRESMDPAQQIVFASLSNIVLDELHLPSKKPLIDVMGRPGAYVLYLS